MAEAIRRSDEIRSGEVKPIAGEEVLREVRRMVWTMTELGSRLSLEIQSNRFAASQWPPSTTSTVPLIYAAASEQRNKAAFSISAISPKRPNGIL